MNTLAALVLSLAVCATAQDQQQQQPQPQQQPPAEILSDTAYVRPDGYNFEFKTSDGISRNEEAQLITVGDQQGIGIKGSYSFISPDGLKYVVEYTADDKGYKPVIHIEPTQ